MIQLRTTLKLLLAKAAIVTMFPCAPSLFAQSPLSFDVVSVKPSNPDAQGTQIRLVPGGGLKIANAALRHLIAEAFNVRDFQIIGGPAWMDTTRFDIEGKLDSTSAASDPFQMSEAERTQFESNMKQRMQSLLADRFQLKTRIEKKEMPAYVLTVAKNGTKLKPAAEGPAGPRGLRMQRGRMSGTSATLDMVARNLASQLGRPVVNGTGLDGKFDFMLEWVPDTAAGSGGHGGQPEPSASMEASGPTLFTAVQEQLGLKLESRKAPVDIVVIEKVERPSAN